MVRVELKKSSTVRVGGALHCPFTEVKRDKNKDNDVRVESNFMVYSKHSLELAIRNDSLNNLWGNHYLHYPEGIVRFLLFRGIATYQNPSYEGNSNNIK